MSELSAANADKYELYQRAVQSPDRDVSFLEKIFRDTYGHPPKSLREDFCGSAMLAATWASRDSENSATGIDNCNEPLAWAKEAYVDQLIEEGAHISLLEGDVLDVKSDSHDVIVAFNFSYRIFKKRETLMRYFRSVHASLAAQGCFVLDSTGGAKTLLTYEVEQELDGFSAIWEQVKYDPISSEHLAYLHFSFADGSRLEKAFVYDWRLWHLSELRDLLLEAGFSSVTVYWEDADGNGDGLGSFSPVEEAAPELHWVAYIAAFR